MYSEPSARLHRCLIRLGGDVQGVGFRPHVYRLARDEHISGRVHNDEVGVYIDAEGSALQLQRFTDRLVREAPPLARVRFYKTDPADPIGQNGFSIEHSTKSDISTADIAPDAALCEACLADITDPGNRRYRYPFTNCTNCGPRLSIITALPYDRANTTMAAFSMCAACEAEYNNPGNRRFHAQPNACKACGPSLALLDQSGSKIAKRDEALIRAGKAIGAGKIVAVKGLGGFHLICDARNEDAISTLRVRKHRPRKPFALMVATAERANQICTMTQAERRLLTSPQAPIVLMKKRPDNGLASGLAPNNPYLGVMCAYTPLHRLLLDDLGFPVLATSGNHRAEPIITKTAEALHQLQGLADMFLVHNRRIEMALEDSVVRIAAGGPIILRRARGYAPTPCEFPPTKQPIIALGGHFKTTIAKAVQGKATVSAHLGALDSAQIRKQYSRAASALLSSEPGPIAITCDLHPDYASTRFASQTKARTLEVQHHAAHIYAVMAERGIETAVTGLAWDGSGYGPDGSVWGGEGLSMDGATWTRIAHLRQFPLPGGDAAAREPARCALGLLHAADLRASSQVLENLGITQSHASRLTALCSNRSFAPLTSSIGRLFDAVSALTGACQLNSFEGEAAMALEFLAERSQIYAGYCAPCPIGPGEPWAIDWKPMLIGLLRDIEVNMPREMIARRFHNWLADTAVLVAIKGGKRQVILSGGCFQNRVLLETVSKRLQRAEFDPIWPRQFPPNDGALALGQLYGAAQMINQEPV